MLDFFLQKKHNIDGNFVNNKINNIYFYYDYILDNVDEQDYDNFDLDSLRKNYLNLYVLVLSIRFY